MIAFDTNIIVRLLVQDDLDQAAEAERLLREAAEAGETNFPCRSCALRDRLTYSFDGGLTGWDEFSVLK